MLYHTVCTGPTTILEKVIYKDGSIPLDVVITFRFVVRLYVYKNSQRCIFTSDDMEEEGGTSFSAFHKAPDLTHQGFTLMS